MNYTQSPDFAVHVGTGRRLHKDSIPIPTVVSEKDMNSIIWSLMDLLNQAGIAPVTFDENVPNSYNRITAAIQQLASASGAGSQVGSVAQLKSLPKTGSAYAIVAGYYAVGDQGAPGQMWLDLADTTSADNGVTIFVATDGGRWKRVNTAEITTKQAGCRANGTTGDDAAFLNWFRAVRLHNSIGVISDGLHKFLSPLTWDLAGNLGAGLATDAASGLRIQGRGLSTSVLDFRGVNSATPFTLTAGGQAIFDWTFANFQVLTDYAGVGARLGLANLSDAFNSVKIDGVEFKNISNTTQAVSVEINGFYQSELNFRANGGQTGRLPGALGTAMVINRMAFCEAMIAVGNAQRGLIFGGSYIFGNEFSGLDVEEVDVGVIFSGDRINQNIFTAGTIVANTCVQSTATFSKNNRFDAGINLAPYAGGQVFGASRNGLTIDDGKSYISTPAFPSSGQPLTNTTGQEVFVVIFNGSPTIVNINGTAFTVAPGGAGLTHLLLPDDIITVTYTGGCGWVWRSGF
jgi:hypothetical protein